MRKLLILTLSALCAAFSAGARDYVFMPQWLPQAQFAGYYMALEKGFFAEEGLSVKIRHRSQASSSTGLELLETGEVDFMGMQLLQGIIAKSDGHPIYNVMQLSQVSGLWCVSHNPISSPKDMDGLKIGRWMQGYADFCDYSEASNNIHVNWVPLINGISLFVYGAVDAILCYGYNEYVALTLAIGKIPEDHVIKFCEFGYDCPEDGLFVNEDFYEQNRETVEKFVRAAKRGWEYAHEHRAETVAVIMRYIKEAHLQSNMALQKKMLDVYLTLLVNPKTGVADYAPVSKEAFDNIVNGFYNINHIFRKIEYGDLIR